MTIKGIDFHIMFVSINCVGFLEEDNDLYYKNLEKVVS